MPVLCVAVPEVKGKVADLDRAACLPSAVHPLWHDAVRLEIEHGIDVLSRFLRNPHHIEERPVIAVVYPAFHHVLQKEITVSRVAKPYIRHKNPPFLNLPELGRHQLIQLRIAGELVDKRHKGAAYFQKPLSCPYIGDIAHLQVGDVKELCKLNPIRRRLVEHDDKLAVGKHRPRRVALQEVVYILGDTSTVRPVLTHTLPEGKEEVCRVFMLKEQVNLVNENKGVPAFRPVLGDAV